MWVRGSGRGHCGERKKEMCSQGKNSKGEREERSQRHKQVTCKGSKQTLVGVWHNSASFGENVDLVTDEGMNELLEARIIHPPSSCACIGD